MNRREYRKMAIRAAVIGVLSFVASSTVVAQQAFDAPATPRASPRTPPPNPQPPQANPVQGAAPAEPGYLGLIADDRQEKGTGVRVVELEAGGPAEQAGLKADDLITGINGTPVHNQSDMGPILERLTQGNKVKFEIDRGGKPQSIEVILGKRPPVEQRRFEKFGAIPESLPEPNAGAGNGPEPSGVEPGQVPADAAPNGLPRDGAPLSGPDIGNLGAGGVPKVLLPDTRPLGLGNNNRPSGEPSHRPLLGVRTKPVTEEMLKRLRLPSANGALVVTRTDGSPAAMAGIPLNAVITAVDGQPIASPPDLTSLVAQAGAGREIEITYLYDGSEHRAKVKLAEFAAAPSSLLGGGSVNVGAVPAPPAPQFSSLPVPDDKNRIESLERRVQQLEHRVDDLERAMSKSK